jgi:hypothetical protein
MRRSLPSTPFWLRLPNRKKGPSSIVNFCFRSFFFLSNQPPMRTKLAKSIPTGHFWPKFCRTICLTILCFHTHSGFNRTFLTSLWVSPRPALFFDDKLADYHRRRRPEASHGRHPGSIFAPSRSPAAALAARSISPPRVLFPPLPRVGPLVPEPSHFYVREFALRQ